jgi:hypothetical protein
MSLSNHIVYGYADPRDGALRYVGKSSTGLARPKQFGSHGHRCGNWIKQLASQGMRPKILVLDALSPDASSDDLNFAEVSAISKYRRLGCDLTNLTDGGDGPMRGRKHTDETREKMSGPRASMKGNTNFLGRKHTPATIEKMRAAKLGKPRSEETKAKISASKIGKSQSEEHISKRTAWCKGSKQSADHIANRVASRLANKLLKSNGDKGNG